MQRIQIDPRNNWQQILESYGFEHHSVDEVDYWNESAYYSFTMAEIDQIETATNNLESCCLELVTNVIKDENLFKQLHISDYAKELIIDSWERDEHGLYGRFDLSMGTDGSLKMLEYNADTPTSLFEASVAQWEWIQARFPDKDQFNSIHERLIAAWGNYTGTVYFSSLQDSESLVTTGYMQDVAEQARLKTEFISIQDIGVDPQKFFVDLGGHHIDQLFKLYPWEWLLSDEFGKYIKNSRTRLIEPAWKMILSNKAMLPLLYEMFPDHDNILPASYEKMEGMQVKKPVFGREGSNVSIMQNDEVLMYTDGDYDKHYIYQKYHDIKRFSGLTPIIGSWVVHGEAAGIGIREDNAITGNLARFVPHIISE